LFSEATPPFPEGDSATWAAPEFGLSWQADENNLLYLRIAKGYGGGGVYPTLGSSGPSPQYPSDSLWSYEIGSKHELWNGRLRLATGVFHIAWDNGLPDLRYVNAVEHIALPGRTVSNGFDVTADALVAAHTKAALSLAYTGVHITQTVKIGDKLFVRAGDPLPVSPWNVTASLEQELPLSAGRGVNLRIEDVFRSTPGPTSGNDPASVYYQGYGGYVPVDPSTNVLNVRAGVHWPGFEVAALLSNALNAHPILSGSSNGVDNVGTPSQVFTLVPRTLSLYCLVRRPFLLRRPLPPMSSS
jgi:outer membrane receptor protein involved in Fe transport